MEFLVKLVLLVSTDSQDAMDDMYANCSNIIGDLWLFEGELFALHEGIKLKVLDEKAIPGYGDLNSSERVEMIKNYFDFDHDLLKD
jgi:hypothetical protein